MSSVMVGVAVVGAVSADRAADKQADATKKGLKGAKKLAAQSRSDAITLYNQGKRNAQIGLGSAFNFYKQAAPSRYKPVMLGNAAAQGVIGQGAVQANNAILGNPVNMNFAQPQVINPDMTFMQNAQLPAIEGQVFQPQAAPVAQLGNAQAQQMAAGIPANTYPYARGGLLG